MKRYKEVHYEVVSSTNTLVKKTYLDLMDHTLIRANYQTHGRGRRDNQWFSQKNKNFLGSFYKISKPSPPFKYLLEAAIALITTLESLDIVCTIKPPNDIYVNDKKIAGILIEVIHGDIHHVISGIGLNVNESVDKTSISMNQVLDIPLFVEEVTKTLKKNFERAETLAYNSLFDLYILHVEFNKVFVLKNNELKPLIAINEAFECLVENCWQSCESLTFTYKG
jgi:biotin-[acetyl-CoA-carboxylase] ligase BirA-like protein